MKKILSVFALVAALVLCMTAFAACTDPESGEPMIVDGKTFVFDSVEIELTDEGKERMESMGMTIDEMKEMTAEEYERDFEGLELSFADGKVDRGFGDEVEYTQDGGDIYAFGEVLTVKGNKLIMENSEDWVTVHIIFVQK